MLLVRARNLEIDFDWQAIVDLTAQRNHPDPRWWQELVQIECDTLVMWGGPASQVDGAEMQQMVERIPAATLITIEAGHHIHKNRPIEFVDAADRFLARGRDRLA